MGIVGLTIRHRICGLAQLLLGPGCRGAIDAFSLGCVAAGLDGLTSKELLSR